MATNKNKGNDYKTLSAAKEKDKNKHVSLKPSGPLNKKNVSAQTTKAAHRKPQQGTFTNDLPLIDKKDSPFEIQAESINVDSSSDPDQQHLTGQENNLEKELKFIDRDLLTDRRSHAVTYIFLYLFSFLVLFRPYEIVSSLSFLSATAVYFAVATLLIYVPTQFSSEGNITILSTEVKAILTMTAVAFITIPIAKDPALAWEKFTDPFIKAVLMFVVMVNVLRTRRRLMGLIWLSLGIGIYLAYTAISLYQKGEFAVEDYRVRVDIGGMFGNPNDMALHFVIVTPLAIALGLATKNNLLRLFYFSMVVLFLWANMVTFSRGGFLGLLGSSIFLVWKLRRIFGLKIIIPFVIGGVLMVLAAPGNYGIRILSIFIPGLDPVGSRDERWELLMRSIIVTLRNPWGIGIGNYPIVGLRNLVSHNSYTQVSAELGITGLVAYLYFILSPFRKLAAIEHRLFANEKTNWHYFMAIGLQVSIVGFMITSFFGSVAYNWFIYYLIAYAVAFRRIYQTEVNSG